MAFMYDALSEFRKYYCEGYIAIYIKLDDGTLSTWVMHSIDDIDIVIPGQRLHIHDERGSLEFYTFGEVKYSMYDMQKYVPEVIEQINERFNVIGDIEFIDTYDCNLPLEK